MYILYTLTHERPPLFPPPPATQPGDLPNHATAGASTTNHAGHLKTRSTKPQSSHLIGLDRMQPYSFTNTE